MIPKAEPKFFFISGLDKNDTSLLVDNSTEFILWTEILFVPVEFFF